MSGGEEKFSIFPGGPDERSCENCNGFGGVKKFKGSYLCKSCRQQWASID